jgi:glycosyltransferase involved in cell wall biosynthesis
VPEEKNLGYCLNYGISKANYKTIAKFDDDDYYSPSYIRGMVRAMKRSGASIIGKRTFYMYLEGKKLLLLMRPKRQNRMVRHVAGGTLFFRKRVAQKVPFSTRLESGTDVRFLRNSRAMGFNIYSGDKYNYVAIRRKSKKDHTWKAKDSKLLKGNVKIIAKTEYFRKRVKKKYSKK